MPPVPRLYDDDQRDKPVICSLEPVARQSQSSKDGNTGAEEYPLLGVVI
jgi:hypothetical protein